MKMNAYPVSCSVKARATHEDLVVRFSDGTKVRFELATPDDPGTPCWVEPPPGLPRWVETRGHEVPADSMYAVKARQALEAEGLLVRPDPTLLPPGRFPGGDPRPPDPAESLDDAVREGLSRASAALKKLRGRLEEADLMGPTP